MMKINWKIRFKNKTFWIAIIPATLILIQSIGAVFGITLDFKNLEANLLEVVKAAFAFLAVWGVVVDHTTKGSSDSERALSYTELK